MGWGSCGLRFVSGMGEGRQGGFERVVTIGVEMECGAKVIRGFILFSFYQSIRFANSPIR
jgi:hypothetical protein